MATSRSDPSPEELAAIVAAAVVVAWPSQPPAPPPAPERLPARRARRWRFSGRWWDPANAAGRRR